MKRFFATSCFLAVAFFPVLTSAQEKPAQPELSVAERAKKVEETVALARKYLGGSAKLDTIKSMHSKGVLVYGSGESGTIDSVFKSPNFHQFVSVIGGKKETSTLNRSEAWRKLEKLDSPGSFTLDFYEIDDVRHLEATVIDTLSFLNTPPTRKGRIEYLGLGSVNDEEAIVLEYIHSDRIWFRRFFDPKTGRVMHMINDKGILFTYEGRLEVDGVVFPQKTIVRFVSEFGSQSMEISFSSIELNVAIDEERFRVPTTAE